MPIEMVLFCSKVGCGKRRRECVKEADMVEVWWERKWLQECSISSHFFCMSKWLLLSACFLATGLKHQSTCLSSLSVSFSLSGLGWPSAWGSSPQHFLPCFLTIPHLFPFPLWRLTDVLKTVGSNTGKFLEVTVGCFHRAEMWDNCPKLLPSGCIVLFFLSSFLSPVFLSFVQSIIPAFIHFLTFSLCVPSQSLCI